MVSKDKYYELKARGNCVKCGKIRGESTSEVRCAECHERYLDLKKIRQKERLASDVCIQCGQNELLGNSKYCSACREKNASCKKNLSEQTISVYKESNSNCRLCDGPVDTLGIICQKCLDQVQFTKRDAMVRYYEQCIKCSETDPEKLVFSSVDISVPMKHTGPDLYRFICFSSIAPKDYILVCSSCYWQANFDYIKHLRSVLLDDAAENDDIIINAIAKMDDSEADEVETVELD